MKVCIVQHDIVWQNPEENIRRMEARLDRAPQADLYVLAEMWATGFGDAPTVSLEAELWMRQMSREMKAALAGSLAVEDGGVVHNRLLFVKPDGAVAHYDKRHLFAPGGEKDYFGAGCERTVVEWGGVRFLLQVCYDLRFPVWSRNRGDYDAMLFVANWPARRMLAWQTLLRARAIENQCYVVGVNRVGTDPVAEYVGGSTVFDAYGNCVAQCGADEGFATAELDMERLREFRQKFLVLEDRDNFTII